MGLKQPPQLKNERKNNRLLYAESCENISHCHELQCIVTSLFMVIFQTADLSQISASNPNLYMIISSIYFSKIALLLIYENVTLKS